MDDEHAETEEKEQPVDAVDEPVGCGSVSNIPCASVGGDAWGPQSTPCGKEEERSRGWFAES